jgi:hypothetical protein
MTGTPDEWMGGKEPDSTADARWISFAELAAARGISKASAIKLVRRHGWRRQRDNQGHVRALVPLTWAQDDQDGAGDNLKDSTPDNSADTGLLARGFAALEDVVAGLRGQLDAANARADEAHKRADAVLALAEQTLGQLAEANARAERAEDATEAQRRRVTALQDDLDMARAQATAAHDMVRTLRQADDARKARGCWRGSGQRCGAGEVLARTHGGKKLIDLVQRYVQIPRCV